MFWSETGTLMANVFNLVELLKSRETSESLGFVRGEWLQNLWPFSDSVKVRPGWGQVAELDTTLGLNLDTEAYGYEKHLGSVAFETTFGHHQVLSVFFGTASTSSMAGEETNAVWNKLFFVRIYDLTTDKHYEEILYRHTSENTESTINLEMSEWYGNYESNKTYSNTKFVNGVNSPFFFQVFDGYVYFGNRFSGLYVYRPADFRNIRRQQLEDSETAEYFSGYSETGIISRMSLVNGQFVDNFRYLSNSELAGVVDIDQIQGRIVYATKRSVYFSDPYRGNSIIALNSVTVPTESTITAVKALRENVLVFTEHETFLYTPSVGSLPSQGRIIKTSEHVGCISPSAITKAGNSLFWVSSTGVYRTDDGIRIQELSEGIQNFFTGNEDVTNPLTSFFETNQAVGSEGYTSIADEQPRTLIQFDPEDVSIAYLIEDQTLLICFPSINGIWCFKRGWSFWPLESMVSLTGAGAPKVGVQQNLTNPWVLETGGDFYLTVGLDSQTIQDQGTTQFAKFNTGIPGPINGTTRSYSILRLGLGGATDRSTVNEDFREMPQKYVATYVVNTDPSGDARMSQGIIYIRPPVYRSINNSYWIPIEYVPPAASTGLFTGFDILLKYDSTNYTTNPAGGTSAITITTEPERFATAPHITALNTDAAGAADATGSYVRFTCTGRSMYLSKKQSNPILYFQLQPRNTDSTSSFGIELVPASFPAFTDNAPNTYNTNNLFTFAPAKVDGERHYNDAKAQPVDWAFKSGLKSNDGTLVRSRGLFSRMASRGVTASTDGQLHSGWLWGIYNTLLGSDRKGYTTQILDIGAAEDSKGVKEILNKTSLRTRFRNSAGNLVTRVFAGGPLWGREGNAAAGDYLIDDTQFDNIVTSDSVKGEELAYMVFGFMRGRADSLVIEYIKANIQSLGKRRRTGR